MCPRSDSFCLIVSHMCLPQELMSQRRIPAFALSHSHNVGEQYTAPEQKARTIISKPLKINMNNETDTKT